MKRSLQKSKFRLLCVIGVCGILFAVIAPLFSQEGEIEIFKRPALKYEAANLKDPFEDALPKPDRPKYIRPVTPGPAAMGTPLPAFEVQGLLWGGPMPQAVIDGQVLKVGDVIKDAEIVEISKEGIKLLYNKKIYKLLPPSSAPSNVSEQ